MEKVFDAATAGIIGMATAGDTLSSVPLCPARRYARLGSWKSPVNGQGAIGANWPHEIRDTSSIVGDQRRSAGARRPHSPRIPGSRRLLDSGPARARRSQQRDCPWPGSAVGGCRRRGHDSLPVTRAQSGAVEWIERKIRNTANCRPYRVARGPACCVITAVNAADSPFRGTRTALWTTPGGSHRSSSSPAGSTRFPLILT
jgi:hypothetical protein